MTDTYDQYDLASLPYDALFHIASFLRGRDLLALARVSRSICAIANDHHLWRTLLRRTYGAVLETAAQAEEGQATSLKRSYFGREREWNALKRASLREQVEACARWGAVALVRETLRNTDVDANQLVARTNVLHDACRVGGKEVVVVLVQEFHAEVNKKSMVPIVINTSLPYELNHHTPLSLAAGSGCEELVHWLIEHGARLEMDDCAGCLIAASEKGAPGLVRLFLDKLKPFWPSTGWAAGLLGLGDTTAKSQTLETTFLTAIEKAAISDVAALRVLLADVPVSVVRKATTALNKAIRESNAPAVAELLKHGVPPTKGAGVWGPIHDAAMIGDLEVIRLLVQHGADAGIAVPYGGEQQDAHMLALQSHGKPDVVEFLRTVPSPRHREAQMVFTIAIAVLSVVLAVMAWFSL